MTVEVADTMIAVTTEGTSGAGDDIAAAARVAMTTRRGGGFRGRCGGRDRYRGLGDAAVPGEKGSSARSPDSCRTVSAGTGGPHPSGHGDRLRSPEARRQPRR